MFRRFAFVSMIALSCGAVAFAQSAPAAQPQAPATGQAAPGQVELKNVQVLKDMNHDQIIQSMQFITAALGTDCETCHVGRSPDGQTHFDLDDKKPKKTAREMMKMVKGINDSYFEGHSEVTCATCHSGHENPRAFPPIADLDTLKARLEAQQRQRQQQQTAQNQPPAQPGQQQPGQSGPPSPEAAATRLGVPTPAALFAKYEQAIGGADALAKLTSRWDKYTTTNPVNGNTSSGETLKQAPDKVLATVSANNGSNVTAYDGSTAWSKNQRGVQPITGPNLDQMKLVANFWRDLKFSDRYQQSRPLPKTTVNGHDAYQVRGVVKGTRIQEQLFFDAQSGLLLRRITYRPTPMGPLPDQIDFEDYRDVGGVKVPFVLKTATPDSASVRQYTEVKFNVPVESAKFAMPAAEPNKQAQ
jgi:hypothetical protein